MVRRYMQSGSCNIHSRDTHAALPRNISTHRYDVYRQVSISARVLVSAPFSGLVVVPLPSNYKRHRGRSPSGDRKLWKANNDPYFCLRLRTKKERGRILWEFHVTQLNFLLRTMYTGNSLSLSLNWRRQRIVDVLLIFWKDVESWWFEE